MQIFAISAGWNESGPRLIAEVGAVDLRPDPREPRREQQQDPAVAIRYR